MPKKCICASAVIVNKGKVYLLKHKKLGVWLYPGGHVDSGEMPHDTAVRETLEETGFEIKLLNHSNRGAEKAAYSGKEAHELPKPFTIMYENVKYKTGKHIHFDMVYLAKATKRKRFRVSSEESKTFKWVGPSEIKRLKTYPNVEWTLLRALELSKAVRKKK